MKGEGRERKVRMGGRKEGGNDEMTPSHINLCFFWFFETVSCVVQAASDSAPASYVIGLYSLYSTLLMPPFVLKATPASPLAHKSSLSLTGLLENH